MRCYYYVSVERRVARILNNFLKILNLEFKFDIFKYFMKHLIFYLKILSFWTYNHGSVRRIIYKISKDLKDLDCVLSLAKEQMSEQLD